MHRFFRYLETRRSAASRPGNSPGTPDKESDKEIEELRQLWESSVPRSAPPHPDVDAAWENVQLHIARAQEVSPQVRRVRFWNAAAPSPRRLVLVGAAALAVFLAVFLIPYFLGESYQTGKGGQLTVTLQDSSTVVLSGNSSLALKRNIFGRVTRTTLKGRGFFSIQPQESPLIVTTAIGNVRVVGTEFDVRCDSANLYVAVVHGIVAVSSSSGAVDSTVFVHTGEYALCSRGGLPDPPRRSLTNGEPIWLSGTLTFAHASVQDLCSEISRQLGVRIKISRGELDTLKVTGLIRGKDARQILSALCDLTETHVREGNDVYTLY